MRGEPEVKRLGSVAKRKKRVRKGDGRDGGEMEGDVVEDLVWDGLEGHRGGPWDLLETLLLSQED